MAQDNLTQEDREQWGADLVEASRRWAEPVVREHVGRLERELSDVRASQQRQQLQSNRDAVTAALDRDPEIGDKWRTLNNDAAFLRWLAQNDPLSGQKLHDLMIHAFNAGDSTRVGHFFRSFIASRRPARERVPGRQQPFEPGRQQPSVTLRDADNRQKVWTRPEIEKFYREKARGLFDGREAEAMRIEQSIIDAGRERRVSGVPMTEYWSK
jgi:hypothetical protein